MVHILETGFNVRSCPLMKKSRIVFIDQSPQESLFPNVTSMNIQWSIILKTKYHMLCREVGWLVGEVEEKNNNSNGLINRL